MANEGGKRPRSPTNDDDPNAKRQRRHRAWSTEQPTGVDALQSLILQPMDASATSRAKAIADAAVAQAKAAAMQVMQTTPLPVVFPVGVSLIPTSPIAHPAHVYVGNVPFDVTEGAIRAIFSAAGVVKSVVMPTDPSGIRHRGFGFVEFLSPLVAQSAIAAFNGFQLSGRSIKVGRPTGPMPAASATPTATTPLTAPVAGVDPCRLYVGNINFATTEVELRVVFGAVGPLRSCQLMMDVPMGRHKGYGFIEYERAESATAALEGLQGMLLGGRQIKIGRPSGGSAVVTTQIPQSLASAAALTLPLIPAVAPTIDDLSQDHFISSSAQRVSLMEKLAGVKTTRVVRLDNMLEPEDVDDDVEGETREQCEKFGTVLRVHITKSAPVIVYIMFARQDVAERARAGLEGRIFNGRHVHATYADESVVSATLAVPPTEPPSEIL